MTRTIGSLFAGIGGLELGLERAGVGRTVWQVEQDPFCREVLARHWPDADRSVTDVRDASASNLAPVAVICGGFPCQGLSSQGHRAGLADARSGLWGEFARIVRELRPELVVIENVPNLAADGLDVVLGDLAAIGMDAEWTMLRAGDVGAPHVRERLFVLAYPADQRREETARVLPGEPGAHGAAPAWDVQPAGALRGRPVALPDPAVLRVAHGVVDRLDESDLSRVHALGNAVVPAVAEVVGRRAAEVLL